MNNKMKKILTKSDLKELDSWLWVSYNSFTAISDKSEVEIHYSNEKQPNDVIIKTTIIPKWKTFILAYQWNNYYKDWDKADFQWDFDESFNIVVNWKKYIPYWIEIPLKDMKQLNKTFLTEEWLWFSEWEKI